MLPLLAALLVASATVSTALPRAHSYRRAALNNATSLQPAYDFIIVGGGTAGMAVANRLTENAGTTVLVVEDGPEPTVVEAYLTPGAEQFIPGSQIDWGFATIPQVALDDRIIPYPRGRCLGGSSAINGLTYMRGSASIYDNWEALGNPGWSWSGVFPYFKKASQRHCYTTSTKFVPPTGNNTRDAGYDPSAYSDGPVSVAYADYVVPVTYDFVSAMATIGVPLTTELNAGNNTGAKREVYTSDGSKRISAYDAYYVPVRTRANLQAVSYGQVQQVLLKQSANGSVAATGILYSDVNSGRMVNVTANKEVIMAAGTFQTPQLLMLSGIGPPAGLEKNGIAVVVANDNIGQHLQDHSEFSIIAQVKAADSASSLYNDVAELQSATAEYASTGQGPLTASPGPGFAFERINSSELSSLGANSVLAQNRTDQAHVEYLIETIFYPEIPTPNGAANLKNESFMSLTANIIAPASRGNVTLFSSSIQDAPVINPGYLTSPEDLAVQVRNFRKLRQLLASPAFANVTLGPNHGEVAPGTAVQSDADVEAYIRAVSWNIYHACGTCRMLPEDAGGVVDSHLRVYGVSGLRVVDASVFPIIPDAHTQGPVYMVAEKAADLIKQDWGL